MNETYLPEQVPQYYQEMQTSDADKWRFNTRAILEEFRHFLLGEAQNDKGEWIRIGKCLMNEGGIKECVSYMIPVINPNTLFSFLTKDEIYDMTRMATLRFNDLFYEKGEDFDLEPFSVPILLNTMSDFIFATLKRAQDGGERKSLTQMFEERVIRTQTDQNKKGFRVPSIFGGKKEEMAAYG
jgi:hypothetical protein